MKKKIILIPILLVVLLLSGCKKEPVACFYYSGQGLRTSFFADCSVDAAQFSWDFGDGASSVGETVVHTYQDFGTYTVRLDVETKRGKTSTISGEVIVKPEPNHLFDGIYSLSESCTGGTYVYSVLVAPDLNTHNQATFNGLHLSGSGITAVVDSVGASFTIARQALDGLYQIQSTNGTINADGTQINLTYQIFRTSNGNLEDECVAVLTK